MSKLTRIVLAVLVSLGVLVAVYGTVQSESFAAQVERSGAHLVGGALVNLDRYREAAPAPVQSDFESGKGEGGHGCESESQSAPID